jgi:hypothetical protein
MRYEDNEAALKDPLETLNTTNMKKHIATKHPYLPNNNLNGQITTNIRSIQGKPC